MDSEGAFDSIVGRLYESSLEPTAWVGALKSFGEWIGAEAFHMFAWDVEKGDAKLSLVSDTSFAKVIREFDEHYSQIDVVREKALTIAPGQFFVTQDHFEDRFVRSNEWFQEFLIPNGMCWSTGGTVPVSSSIFAVLAMLRAADRGRYSEEELARARRVWPHYKRALSLFSQTERLRSRRTWRPWGSRTWRWAS